MASKGKYNRLYDTRFKKNTRGIRTDALFVKACETLVEFGYTGVSEAIYDAVYQRLNELSPAYQYPTLKVNELCADEADRELERALSALNAIKGDLGVMAS